LLFVLFVCYLCCSFVICVVRLLFVLFICYLCFSFVICVVRLLFVLFVCYLCCSFVICVVHLLFVLFVCYLCCSFVICVVQCIVCVYMCTVLLPPGDNPVAVNKYIISLLPLTSSVSAPIWSRHLVWCEGISPLNLALSCLTSITLLSVTDFAVNLLVGGQRFKYFVAGSFSSGNDDERQIAHADCHLKLLGFLIFIGPYIIIYSYSTTNKMHLLSQIIYSCKTLYMFRTVFPSIIRS
jgi:hypothetical protein